MSTVPCLLDAFDNLWRKSIVPVIWRSQAWQAPGRIFTGSMQRGSGLSGIWMDAPVAGNIESSALAITTRPVRCTARLLFASYQTSRRPYAAASGNTCSISKLLFAVFAVCSSYMVFCSTLRARFFNAILAYPFIPARLLAWGGVGKWGAWLLAIEKAFNLHGCTMTCEKGFAGLHAPSCTVAFYATDAALSYEAGESLHFAYICILTRAADLYGQWSSGTEKSITNEQGTSWWNTKK